MSTQVDPKEINAVVSKLLDFLEQQTATSMEVQRAALATTAELLDQTMMANQTAEMKQSARTFWQRRNK